MMAAAFTKVYQLDTYRDTFTGLMQTPPAITRDEHLLLLLFPAGLQLFPHQCHEFARADSSIFSPLSSRSIYACHNIITFHEKNLKKFQAITVPTHYYPYRFQPLAISAASDMLAGRAA